MRIALLEDDPGQTTVIRQWLKEAGHDCVAFAECRALLRVLRRESFDLFILEWALPDGSGLDVVKVIRARFDWNPPILFATLRQREEDIVEALLGGADAYIVKPIRRREMIARIKALARRSSPAVKPSRSIVLGPYELDSEKKTLSRYARPLTLTEKEFRLVELLFRNAGRTLSRSHLTQAAWQHCEPIQSRALDTHISNLRRKLKLTADTGIRIKSIYQHGYRLDLFTPENPSQNRSKRSKSLPRPARLDEQYTAL